MRAALVISLIVLTVVGCDWGGAEGGQTGGASRQAEATPAPEAPEEPVGPQLAPVLHKLDRDYDAEVIADTQLPATKPLAPRPTDDLPNTLKPVEGLRATLPDGQPGFVFSYASHDLAQAAASSFLIRGPIYGVRGCGRIIYFGETRNPSAERWQRDVASTLSPCDPGEFLAIE